MQIDHLMPLVQKRLYPAEDTDRFGLFLLEETSVGDGGTLELGMRLEQQDIRAGGGVSLDHNRFNLSDSVLHPFAGGRAGLIISRSERAPVAEELLSDGEHIATASYEIGDSDLDTESSANLELTWTSEWQLEATEMEFRASIYHSRFDGYIFERDTGLLFNEEIANGIGIANCFGADTFHDQEEAEEAPRCFAYDQQDATFTGFEAELNMNLAGGHTLRLWVTWCAPVLIRVTFPVYLRRRLGVGWGYNLENWSLGLDLTRASAQDRPGFNQQATAGWTRLDAYASYNFEGWSAFLKASNLSDEEIRNSTSLYSRSGSRTRAFIDNGHPLPFIGITLFGPLID